MAHKVTPTAPTHNGRVSTRQPPIGIGFGTPCAFDSAMSTRPLAHQVVPGKEGPESASAEQGAVRPRDSFFHWCGTADALRQASKPGDRQALLRAYFGALAEESIAPAARLFAGGFLPERGGKRPLASGEVVIGAMENLAQMDPTELRERCRTAGDLGCVAAELFAGRLPSGLAMSEVAAWGQALASARSDGERQSLVQDMLSRLSSLEAQYLVNLVVGRLDTGLDESDVEEARRSSRGGATSGGAGSSRPR